MTIQEDGWHFNVELTHLYRDVMWITEQATGMSQTRIEIMHELFHADELSQAELQQHLGVEGAVVTRIVKQLEAAGMVSRRPDPNDNRFTLVSMTDYARSQHASHTAATFKQNLGEQLMAGLTEDDRANLLRMIEIVQKNARGIREKGGV